MKFRNDGNRDIAFSGYHFAIGQTVEVTLTDADKLAWLARNLTAIEQTEVEPVRTMTTTLDTTTIEVDELEPGFYQPEEPTPRRRGRPRKGEFS